MPRLLALLLFVVALAAGPVRAQDEQDDRGFLTGLIEQQLSDIGRTVTINGFRGALSSRATFTSLTIADRAGVWLTISDGAISWNRSALLGGRVEIAEMTAGRIEVHRAPQPEPSPGPVKWVAFRLPELPVSVNIGELRADQVVLDESLLGKPVTGRMEGRASLAGGEGSAQFRLDRTDGELGEVAFEGAFANATRQATLDLLMREGPGGIAATVLGLPGEPSVELALAGTGEIDDFRSDIVLSTDGSERLRGQVSTRAAPIEGTERPDRSFAMDVRGDISPLLFPEFQPFFGDDISLEADGVWRADGGIDLSRLVLDSDGADVTGRLSLAPNRLPRAVALTVRLGLPTGEPLRLPVSGTPTFVDNGVLRLRFDETKGTAWNVAGDLNGFRQPELEIETLVLDGSGRILAGRSGSAATGNILGRVAFSADGILPADPALAAAIGSSMQGSTVFRWDDEAGLKLRGLNAQAGDLTLSGDLQLALTSDDARLTSNLRLQAADLGRFSQLAGRRVDGSAAIRLNGSLLLASGRFDGTMIAHSTALELGLGPIDEMLAGTSVIEVTASGVRDDVIISDFEVTLRGLTAHAQGRLAPAGSDLSMDVVSDDLSVLGLGLGGDARAELHLTGPAGARVVTLSGRSSGLGLGIPEADLLMAGAPTFSLVVRERNGRFMLTALHAESVAAQLGLDEEPGTEGLLRLAGRVNDIGTLATGFPGALTVSGTVDARGPDIAIDLGLEGPGSMRSEARGTLSRDLSQVNLRLAGSLQSAIANSFITPRSVLGPVDFDLVMQGPPALSSLSGTVTARGLRFVSSAENLSAQNANVSARIQGGSADLDYSFDVANGGHVDGSGRMTLSPPFDADLSSRIRQVTLVEPGLFTAIIDGDVRITGALLGGAVISGQVVLDHTELVVGSEIADTSPLPVVRHVNTTAPVLTTLRRAGLGLDGGSGDVRPVVFGLDLELSAPNRIFVRGRGLDAELGGSIHLGGTTANVQPTGEFELRRGRFNLLGRRFTLDKGLVHLYGSMVPTIEFEASADAFGVTTTIVVDGTLLKPELHLFSTANVPEDEILSQLIFGRSASDISDFQILQLLASVAETSGWSYGDLLARIRTRLDLDDLDIIVDDTGDDSYAAIAAGRYLSDRAYSQVVIGQDGRSRVQLDFDVTDDLSVTGAIGTRGETGAGFLFTKDY